MKRFEKNVPRVIAVHDRVAKRPRIAAYLASERRIPFNEWGISSATIANSTASAPPAATAKQCGERVAQWSRYFAVYDNVFVDRS